MRCQYCGRIIPDDSAFCPECGQRQEELSFHAESSFDSTQESKPEVCPVCGTVMEEGTLFCPECGTPYARSEQQSGTRFEDTEEMPYISSPEDSEELLKVRDEEEFEEFGSQRDGRGDMGNQGNVPDMRQSLDESYGKKKSKAPIIIGVVIGGIVLVAIVIAVLFFVLKKEDPKPSSDSVNTDITEPSENEILNDVDYNLLDEDELFFEGFIKKTENGDYVLRLEEEYTFYGEDFYGEKVLLEDARNVYIDQSVLPEGMLDSIKSNQTIEIEGQFYFDNDKLYITPFVIWDEYGENLIEDFEKSKEEDEVLNKDYILPQSASYLLTESDIEGLDIREINYAKNEIYARHGRLFQSAELQNYFNSKKWYHGTVSPEEFNNSMLSEIERENADFLAQVEFGMDPKGYQLDAE